MSNVNELKALVVQRLAAEHDVGQIYEYQRYITNKEQLNKNFSVNGYVHGGFVSWPSGENDGGGVGTKFQRELKLVLFRSLSDDDRTELQFDAEINNIINQFTRSKRVGGWLTQNSWRLEKNSPATYCGVLCHYAILRAQFITTG